MTIVQDYQVAIPKSLLVSLLVFLVCSPISAYYTGKTAGIELGKQKALEVLEGKEVPCEVVEYKNSSQRITVVRAGYLALDKEISDTDRLIIKGNELYRK